MSIKIAIDAGHGSNTAGKRTPPLPEDIEVNGEHIKAGEQYREHWANVGVCVFLEAALRRCGFNTLRVSWDDPNSRDDDNVLLGTRQSMIKAAGCEISVSIHFNAYGYGADFNAPAGVLTYIHSSASRVGDSRALAQKVQKYLAGGTAQNDRGVMTEALAMCNCPAMGTKAAILCELAFMTNLVEATTMMMNTGFWRESAEEICRGVCDYTGVVYKEDDMANTVVYETIDDVPVFWRPSIKELISANALDGGTDNAINDQDVGLTASETRVLVIMKRYADSLLK